MSKILLVVGVLLLLLVGYLFLGNRGAGAPVSSPSITDNSGKEDVVNNTPVQEVVVEASEYKFSPSTIKVDGDKSLKIVFRNKGTMQHDLVVEELKVGTKLLSPGQEESIEIGKVDPNGYTFYCSVGNHRAMGMEGKIEVK